MRSFSAMSLAVFVAVSFCGCGESSIEKAAREERESQAAALKFQNEQTKAKRAMYDKYLADCKAKNGEKHWGPFTADADYRKPYVWYKNGRFSTIKPRVASVTQEVWDAAEKQHACVVAPLSGGFAVTLALDNGASFAVTKRIPQRGVPRRDWKRQSKLVTEVSVPIQ